MHKQRLLAGEREMVKVKQNYFMIMPFIWRKKYKFECINLQQC